MSHFTLRRLGCDVKLPEDLSREQLLGFAPFDEWVEAAHVAISLQDSEPAHKFHHDPYQIHSVTVTAVVWFNKGTPSARPGFMMVEADIRNKAGDWIPGTVFLRGRSVAMLVSRRSRSFPCRTDVSKVILQLEEDKDDKYVLLTTQPRIAAGSLAFTEIPAGMVDGNGNFAGTAAKEIREECHLVFGDKDMLDMTKVAVSESNADKMWQKSSTFDAPTSARERLQQAIYPSPGACDEAMALMLCQKKMTVDDMKSLEQAVTGLEKEGERINLRLVKLRDAWREVSRDAKALAALQLYESLLKEKMIGEPRDFLKIAKDQEQS
jgi:ADP-sugar diphosphatase